MAAIPREPPHCGLQHEAEHEGKHDRQDDLGCHKTGGKHCEKKKAAQKHRIDIRRYGQIVFVSRCVERLKTKPSPSDEA
jgi:hypothetical protein